MRPENRKSAQRTFHGKLLDLGFKSYGEYLRSAHWRRLREAHRTSDQQQDCFCGETEHLQLHHLTYERLGREELDDLRWLCKRCHALVHVLERRGDIGIDLVDLESTERAIRYAQDQEPLQERASADWSERDAERDRENLKVLSRQIKSLPQLVPEGTDLTPFYAMVRAEMDALVDGQGQEEEAA
jgi:hypothetical protein